MNTMRRSGPSREYTETVSIEILVDAIIQIITMSSVITDRGLLRDFLETFLLRDPQFSTGLSNENNVDVGVVLWACRGCSSMPILQ